MSILDYKLGQQPRLLVKEATRVVGTKARDALSQTRLENQRCALWVRQIREGQHAIAARSRRNNGTCVGFKAFVFVVVSYGAPNFLCRAGPKIVSFLLHQRANFRDWDMPHTLYSVDFLVDSCLHIPPIQAIHASTVERHSMCPSVAFGT